MWDREADVVVVGFGGAGAAAALAANQAGAKVIVLEKNAEGGGNTRYSSGSMRTYQDIDRAVDYFENLCEGTTERDVIAAFVEESSRNPDWVREIGGEVISRPTGSRFPTSHIMAFRNIGGAEGMGPRVRVKGTATAAGIDLWAVLARKVAGTKIAVVNCAPAHKLLVEKDEGVIGVSAVRDGKEIKVRARRGVILTCGGFEYDRSMHLNYLGQAFFGLCNPGNTGDGIRMAGEIGADMWHMSASAATFGYKYPEFDFGIQHSMPYAGFIYVDQMGQRFMDEPGVDSHIIWSPVADTDPKTLERKRVPCYVIFDEDTRMRGAIAETDRGKVSDTHLWSKDNSVEIARGWIKAADSLADLAVPIKLRPEVLQTTVARYNLECVGGYDAQFGRAQETLIPLGRPPYYAVEMWPCVFNTQGGPKRNAKAQVIDFRGQPIKRLYSAGELGSLWHRNYPGAGNVSEALAVGRIAGRNAAAEQPLAA